MMKMSVRGLGRGSLEVTSGSRVDRQKTSGKLEVSVNGTSMCEGLDYMKRPRSEVLFTNFWYFVIF